MKLNNKILVIAYVLSLFLGSVALSMLLFLFAFAFRNEFKKLKSYSLKTIVLWGIAGGLLVLVGQYGWVLIQEHLFLITSESINTANLISSVKVNLGMIFVIAFVCPVLEEIVFRKILFTSIERRIGTITAAIISAFLFSLIHADLTNTAVYMLIGLTFSWIYIKSKNVFAPIISHILMNSIVLITLL